jgi:MoxR-like ATPase
VRATRPQQTDVPQVKEWVRWGAGPRAGQALVLSAKARALLAGRFAVTLDDLRAVAAPVLRHRILVDFRAEADGIDADTITARLLDATPPPRSPLR